MAPERRLTFKQLGSRFTTGPKDKFEHEEVVAVDFELPRMVEFARENKENFASSAKLVVVKVMRLFFGVGAVEGAFLLYIWKTAFKKVTLSTRFSALKNGQTRNAR